MAVCSPPLGELLAQHLPGLALHLNRSNWLAGDVSHDALARGSRRRSRPSPGRPESG